MPSYHLGVPRIPPAAATILVLLALSFLAACGSSPESPPGTPTPPAPPSAPGSPAERLFLLDGAGLHELNGATRVPVATGPAGASLYDAAVSPDGTDVALAVQPPPRQTTAGYDFGVDLYVARDGGEPVPVALHERIAETMSRPVWLPDGDALFFAVLGRDAGGAADPRIDHIDLTSGERRRFVEDALEPALSPDGSRLAYVHYDPASGAETIMLYDLTTGLSQPLLAGDRRMINVANLAWSPDGARLAFASADPILLPLPGAGGRSAVVHPSLRDVWLVNLDGAGLRRVTEVADATLSLAWSADNRHIYTVGDTGFWRLDTTDGRLERLGEPSLGGRVQTLWP